jgi:GTPase SAR1 family protein
MLVYSVASKQSFEMVRIIREKILTHLVLKSTHIHKITGLISICGQGVEWVPLTIVGNKSDLRPEQRQVSVEEGKAAAEEFKCAYTEASARYNENVAKAFELMIGEVEKVQNPSQPTGDNKCLVM